MCHNMAEHQCTYTDCFNDIRSDSSDIIICANKCKKDKNKFIGIRDGIRILIY